MNRINTFALEKDNQLRACIFLEKFGLITYSSMFIDTNAVKDEDYMNIATFVTLFNGEIKAHITKFDDIYNFINRLPPSTFIMHRESPLFETIVTDMGHKIETI